LERISSSFIRGLRDNTYQKIRASQVSYKALLREIAAVSFKLVKIDINMGIAVVV
jgi:hypothetical protein